MKTCTKCKQEKNESEFGKGKRYKNGLRSWCKNCSTEYPRLRARENEEFRLKKRAETARWRKEKPIAERRSRRGSNLKQSFGISLSEYESMSEKQNHRCAICDELETAVHKASGITRHLAVDHCHETGRIRGLLCSKCNPGLGYFQDDPSRLAAAIAYLERIGP